MSIKFKPMPWLTLLTLISLGILLWLGTWQSQRLKWKTNLLVEIDQAAQAAPITSVRDMQELFAAGDPLDFRRVGLTGTFVDIDGNEGQPFHLMMSDGKAMLWHLFQPLETSDGLVYVTTANFPHSQKQTPPAGLEGGQQVFGYVRVVRDASSMQPDNNAELNEWYVFNGSPDQRDWSAAVPGRTIPVGYFIDQVPDATSAIDMAVRKPDLPNNHFEYMLTWYSFALILLVIYFLLHKKQGRLQFGDKHA